MREKRKLNNLPDSDWELIRADYEINNMSYSQIAKKWNVGRSTISNRCNKEGWKQGRVNAIVEKKTNAIKELMEVEQSVEQLSNTDKLTIDSVVKDRLEMEGYFTNAIIKNQRLADSLITRMEQTNEIQLTDVNTHSQISTRNRDAALGKQPTTAVQVNNNAHEEDNTIVVKFID